jgi:hypothetical protein
VVGDAVDGGGANDVGADSGGGGEDFEVDVAVEGRVGEAVDVVWVEVGEYLVRAYGACISLISVRSSCMGLTVFSACVVRQDTRSALLPRSEIEERSR